MTVFITLKKTTGRLVKTNIVVGRNFVLQAYALEHLLLGSPQGPSGCELRLEWKSKEKHHFHINHCAYNLPCTILNSCSTKLEDCRVFSVFAAGSPSTPQQLPAVTIIPSSSDSSGVILGITDTHDTLSVAHISITFSLLIRIYSTPPSGSAILIFLSCHLRSTKPRPLWLNRGAVMPGQRMVIASSLNVPIPTYLNCRGSRYCMRFALLWGF